MPTYLPWLDLLRFVACVLVIVNHLGLSLAGDRLGHNGVGLFFSISGYLIGSVLIGMRDKPHWQTSFYANRFLRDTHRRWSPACCSSGRWWRWVASQPGSWPAFRHNLPYYLTFTVPLLPDRGGPFAIVWTLCVEEYFYLLLPLAFWAFGPRATAVLLLGVIGLTCLPMFEVLPGSGGIGTWFLVPVNLLAGAILAVLRPGMRDGFPWVGVLGVAAVVLNGVFEGFHPYGPVTALVTTLSVWSFATTRATVPRPLRLPVLWGKWSYGIYLVHLPFCSAALRVCRMAGLDRIGPVPFFVAATVLATLGSVAVAAVMYRCLERPILAARPWVNARRWARWPVAVAQVSLVPAGVMYWLATGGWKRWTTLVEPD